MNKTIIFRKIGGIISEITEQYQYLSGDPENINPLELELFVANSHFLSEHLAILKKMDASVDPAVSMSNFATPDQLKPVATASFEPPVEDEKYSEPFLPEPASFNQADEIRGIPARAEEELWFEPLSESSAVYSSSSVKEEIPQILSESDAPANVPELLEAATPDLPEPSHLEVQPAEQSEILNEVNVVKSEQEIRAVSVRETEPIKEADPIKQPEPEEQAEVAREIEPVNETFAVEDNIYQQEPASNNSSTAERVPTLNEVLSAGKNKENPIAYINLQEERDLKSMIKLNDKLMFVRDLFSGYSLAYSEAIELVNRFDNFKSADNFLKQNYAGKYKWAEKQKSVDQFYEILERRFS